MLWPCSTGTPTARRSSMAPPTPCRWSTWCPRTGGRRWSMRAPAWASGSRTSCACWSRCARRSARRGAGGEGGTRYGRCVLVALRKAIRRREIWVDGGNIWRNPDNDLPADFEENRDVHYEALSKPRDPDEFIADLQRRHVAALARLNTALKEGPTGGVRITRRKGEPWISVPPAARQVEPASLKALKEEISRRWGVIDLLDLIKETGHVTQFTSQFTSVASRTVTDPEVIRRRLLLCLYGLGTNVGIKRVADGVAASAIGAAGDDGSVDNEAVLRRTRRLFINRDNLRAAIRVLVNETLAVRDTELRGPGSSCVSDSRKFGSWSANMMTEWHQRYGGPGIMVFWHVERRSVCICSQVTSTTASEVASM